jgi:hypothetical protein
LRSAEAVCVESTPIVVFRDRGGSKRLPGFILILSTCGSAAYAISGEKWISATRGIYRSGAVMASRISGSAFAALINGTASRTISAPCSHASIICLDVDEISEVSVFVIVCITGALPPPITTGPTGTAREIRYKISERG